jgi:hypothetical protein
LSIPNQRAIRVSNDYYPTPYQLTDGLLRVLSPILLPTDILFDCAAGHGAIIKQCQIDYLTTSNEPYPALDYQPDYRLDATKSINWTKFGKIDYTITNTPFDMALMMPMLINAMRHSNKGVAALVRVTWIEPCKDREDFLVSNADQMRYWIPVNPRPKFRTDLESTDSTTVAWAFWDKSWSWKKLGIECPFQFLTGWKNG